jgi:hypothetical protein
VSGVIKRTLPRRGEGHEEKNIAKAFLKILRVLRGLRGEKVYEIAEIPMKQNRIITIMVTALAITLACTIFVGGPEIPEPLIPVSAEAVTSLQEQIKAAVEAGASSGEVILQINETQLTSYLAYKNADNPNPMFTEPQVYLRDGQMRIYGKTQQGNFTANIGIVLAVGLDAEGRPELQLTSADFGPFPLPDGLNKAITAVIEEAYTGALGPVATGFRIQSIAIADGTMTIAGNIR